MGETAIATIEALDAADVPQSRRDVRFSDLASRRVLILSDTQARGLLVFAAFASLIAWVRFARHVWSAGAVHALFTAVWAIAAIAVAGCAMVAAVWLLRQWREAYHPWYAHPLRLLALLTVCGIAAPWTVTRLARLLPARIRYVRSPASVWAIVLPLWAVLAIALERYAPAASHLWIVPLAAAGLLLAVTPPARDTLVRTASLGILVIVALLFLRDGLVLFQFLVTVFGRLPIVTPIAAYPGLVFVLGLMLGPPVVAASIGLVHGGRRHGVAGALLLVALAVATGLAFSADAYTGDRPLRRSVLFLDDRIANRSLWEVGGNEPGLDLELSSVEAGRWRPVNPDTPLGASVRVSGADGAFRFQAPGEPTPPPAAFTWRQSAAADAVDRVEFELVASPKQDGLAVGLELPPGIVPEHATPSGRLVDGRWRTIYVGVPANGIAFRGRVPASVAPELARAAVVVASWRLPGPDGGLPRWLPRERTDWSARARWILPVSAVSPPADPPAALR